VRIHINAIVESAAEISYCDFFYFCPVEEKGKYKIFIKCEQQTF
jgi:hypothetical protein